MTASAFFQSIFSIKHTIHRSIDLHNVTQQSFNRAYRCTQEYTGVYRGIGLHRCKQEYSGVDRIQVYTGVPAHWYTGNIPEYTGVTYRSIGLHRCKQEYSGVDRIQVYTGVPAHWYTGNIPEYTGVYRCTQSNHERPYCRSI